ncbi:MAG: hypothetical protein AABY22_17980 [Nanoarchaeota archaeon]
MEKEKCSRCEKDKHIQNKNRKLCGDCVYELSHDGKSRLEVAKEKQKNKPKKAFVFKPKKIVFKKIKATSKQNKINSDYSETIRKIYDERELICTGCGNHQGGEIKLSNSHIISRKQCQQIGRPDLIADERNITYHCLDFGNHKGCHLKWETAQKVTLLDYEKNMLYIKSIDNSLYEQLKNTVDKHKMK